MPMTISIGAIMKEAILVRGFSTDIPMRKNGMLQTPTSNPAHSFVVVIAKQTRQQMKMY
jgi:hypothetical protein